MRRLAIGRGLVVSALLALSVFPAASDDVFRATVFRFSGVAPVADFLDADGDGISDEWELANGLDPADPADAEMDCDGDGLCGREEFQLDADPWQHEAAGGWPASAPAVQDFADLTQLEVWRPGD